MQKLLLQNTTGAVYPWSESLAKRKDMVDYEPTAKAGKTAEKVETNVVQDDDIKTMAREVLTKGGKKSNEAKVEGQ
jgi:hypothetical protein